MLPVAEPSPAAEPIYVRQLLSGSWQMLEPPMLLIKTAHTIAFCYIASLKCYTGRDG